MTDNYFGQIIRRNWKFFTVLILIIIMGGIIFKNVGEIPYEDQHLMSASTTLKFTHQGEEIRGFVYTTYWVKTSPEISALPTTRLEDYLLQHGQIDLHNYQEQLIAELKTYSLKEIKEHWYSDYKFFKTRDIYFIKNDNKLERFLKSQDLQLDLPHQFKKVFFVYLDEDTFKEYEENSQ